MPMHDWEHLVKHAILGTGQQNFVLPSSHNALEPLLKQLTPHPPEIQLLHAAALVHQYQRLGQEVEKIDAPPLVASTEEDNHCTVKQGELLQHILTYDERALSLSLLNEWLQYVRQNQCCIPYRLLPTLLDLGNKTKSIRPALQPTIGERGKWLVGLNPRWRYMHTTTDLQHIWDTGSPNERQEYFVQQRKADPAKALEQLQATWKQEAVKERESFLHSFWAQLSINDEEFLTTCTGDRSQKIRDYASTLLGSLKDSQQFQTYIKLVSQYISNTKKTTLQVNLPDQYDETWAEWGIGQESKQKGVGEKSWWLYQLLLRIRPSLFLAHFDLSVDDYLKKIRRSDFNELLDDALTDAILAHRDDETAIALIEKNMTKKSFLATLKIFTAILSPEQKYTLLEQAIEKLGAGIITRWIDMENICQLFPTGLPHHLSDYLCTDILSKLLKNYKHSYSVNYTLNAMALLLHPESNEAFHKLDKLWQKAAEKNTNITDFLSIYQFRVTMHKEFNT